MTLLAYHPPKSVSHGHGPRARTARKAWDATQEFLNRQTVAVLHTPIKLSVFGPSQWTDASLVELVRSEAEARFGEPEISGEFHNWALPVEQLGTALDFAFADEGRPTQSLGPSRLFVAYSFEWRTMPNPQTISKEHFGRGNWLGVSLLGRRVVIQPTFLFEASYQDPHFVGELKELEKAMPFVPNDRYYCRLEPKKTGTGEKLVKLPKGWKDACPNGSSRCRPTARIGLIAGNNDKQSSTSCSGGCAPRAAPIW